MIYKKIVIIFLLILSIFIFTSFSSVHASTTTTNETSSSSQRMKDDIDYLKKLLKNKNINNMDDLVSFFKCDEADDIQYFYIEDAGHSIYNRQNVYFYRDFNGVSFGDNNYSYYCVQQNSFTLNCKRAFWFYCSGSNSLHKYPASSFTAPIVWCGVKTADLFNIDSSQIVANSVDNLNNKLTEDNSSQNDINLGSHNDEMDNASNTIKNSNLYNYFSNLSNEVQGAFSYNDDEVSTIPISFNNSNYVLRSDTISSFFKNNHLGFVVTLWQSILWFSLFYTMYIFVRKLYKAVSGGDPVEDVKNTLSKEDDKMIGGF